MVHWDKGSHFHWKLQLVAFDSSFVSLSWTKIILRVGVSLLLCSAVQMKNSGQITHWLF